jgi:deazaflavin-dependent oxidoreductase (nitroreductase family)
MRLDKRKLVTAISVFALNPVASAVVGAGVVPGFAILETKGRKSNKRRRTPVGGRLDGDSFWVVAEHGHRAGYVRNLTASPRVRVKVAGRWRCGTAQVLDHDDPLKRQRMQGHPLNAAAVRALGTELLTIRIDLDPDADA